MWGARPDRSSLLAGNKATAIGAVSHYVYQILVTLQEQQPECLAQKYQKTPWHRPDCQAAFIEKLTKGLSQATDETSLLRLVKKYLQLLLVPAFVASPEFDQLLTDIRDFFLSKLVPQSLAEQTTEVGAGDEVGAAAGIAILLLDAENLQLDAETEKFLATLCTYPIQIKVAFANWRSLGKKDAEFHERGYQLIHVPPGKDSADMKMAAVGASIFVHYPTGKEILICSSDRGLTHLRNTLQSHGLTVYQVRKQGDSIVVLNSQTGSLENYSLAPSSTIPSLDELIQQLTHLIKEEQLRTSLQ